MSNSTDSAEPSRRTLAAIVFTDVANFSARMSTNEEKTLALVHRDLAALTAICEAHHGKVLKSTGDGLLMYFDSAVQAVACALQVQQALAVAAKSLPEEDVLMHRIGIHLGDVFVTATDVMGDGVNVAARLQDEASPGGICISQTVYDVVKNRMEVQATYLGPRDLKNIKDAVPVYQILLEAHAAGAKREARHKTGRGPGWQWVALGTVAAVLVLAGVLIVIVWRMKEQPPTTMQPVVNVTVTQPAASQAASGPGGAAASVAEAYDPAQAKLDAARRSFFGRYNFIGMLAWLEKNGQKDTPMYQRYEKLKALRLFAFTSIQAASETDPIVIEADSDRRGPRASQPTKIWNSAEGDIFLDGPSGRRTVMFDEIQPEVMGKIIAAALKKMPPSSTRAIDLQEGYQIFMQECQSLDLLPKNR